MGVPNAFAKANELMAAELAFRLDPAKPALEFRQRLYLLGWKRFEHCVALCKIDARKGSTGAQRYARLIDLMRYMTPKKQPGTQYRNPQVDAAPAQNKQMDLELATAIAKDP